MKFQRGFSLIELMIAVGLGMVAIAAVGSVFVFGSRSYKQDDRVARMQDELRFAMAQMTTDLEMAGFFAQVRDLVNNLDVDGTVSVAGGDCGPTTDGGAVTASNNWTYMERRAAVVMQGDATAAQANATFPCITTAEFYTGPTGLGTDVIGIKRLAGSKTANESANTVYMKTNGVDARIYKQGAAGSSTCTSSSGDSTIKTACPAPEPKSGTIELYEFKPAVWFLRKWPTGTSGTVVPSLCRKFLTAANPTTWDTECLAQGIEDLQLEFGVDTNTNGVADFFTEYTTRPAIATLAQIVAVRVHLLARSLDPDQDYLDQKTYTLAGRSYTTPFADKYHRRVLSSMVLLRNPASALTPQELPE